MSIEHRLHEWDEQYGYYRAQKLALAVFLVLLVLLFWAVALLLLCFLFAAACFEGCAVACFGLSCSALAVGAVNWNFVWPMGWPSMLLLPPDGLLLLLLLLLLLGACYTCSLRL